MNTPDVLNPFALGGVVRGPGFAGRGVEIARLRKSALGGRSFWARIYHGPVLVTRGLSYCLPE